MKITGAIFDMDGTLLDSMGVWDTAAEEYLSSIGVKPQENVCEEVKTMSLMQAAVYLKGKYHIDKEPEEMADGVNALIEGFYKNEVMLKPGVKEFLHRLAEHDVKMCIATATDRYLVEAAMERCGVREYFTDIFTCSEVGYGKDEPEIYEQALRRLGTQKSDTIIFEDAIHAIKTAKKAGFLVAGVRDDSEKEQETVMEISDYYIADYGKTGDLLR